MRAVLNQRNQKWESFILLTCGCSIFLKMSLPRTLCRMCFILFSTSRSVIPIHDLERLSESALTSCQTMFVTMLMLLNACLSAMPSMVLLQSSTLLSVWKTSGVQCYLRAPATRVDPLSLRLIFAAQSLPFFLLFLQCDTMSPFAFTRCLVSAWFSWRNWVPFVSSTLLPDLMQTFLFALRFKSA